jgi:hypothetical protein
MYENTRSLVPVGERNAPEAPPRLVRAEPAIHGVPRRGSLGTRILNGVAHRGSAASPQALGVPRCSLVPQRWRPLVMRRQCVPDRGFDVAKTDWLCEY